MILYRQKIYSDDMSRDIVKEFLGTLSGFIHKAKVLHWAASGKDIHEYLDDFWKEIYEFQDTVAEGYMGILGQLDTDIVYKPAESDNPWEFVREVESKTVDFYNLLPSDPRYKGLSGEIESFIQEIEKYKYLFSLCNKSEEEKNFSNNEGNGAGGALAAAGAAGLGSGALFVGSKKLSNSSNLKKYAAVKFENGARHLEHEKKMFEDLAERFKNRGGKVTVSGLEEAGAQISNLRNKSEKLAESSRKLSKGSKAAKIGAIGLAATSAAAAGIGISKLSKNKAKKQ